MNYRKDRYNASGCLDMTAYLALLNIERSEKEIRREVHKHSESTSTVSVEVCYGSADEDTYKENPHPGKEPKTARKGKHRQKKHFPKPRCNRKIKRQLTKRAAARKDGERYGE